MPLWLLSAGIYIATGNLCPKPSLSSRTGATNAWSSWTNFEGGHSDSQYASIQTYPEIVLDMSCELGGLGWLQLPSSAQLGSGAEHKGKRPRRRPSRTQSLISHTPALPVERGSNVNDTGWSFTLDLACHRSTGSDTTRPPTRISRFGRWRPSLCPISVSELRSSGQLSSS